MALILRICMRSHYKSRFTEIKHFERALSLSSANSIFKKSVPALQLKYFSTKTEPVPEKSGEYKTIYHGELSSQIHILKLFSLFTSSIGLGGQPLLLMKMHENPTIAILCCVMSLVAVLTPILIHLITRKYVTHIYYNEKEDKYSLTTYNVFARLKKMEFTRDDLVIPGLPGFMTSCLIKDKPLFLYKPNFKNSADFAKLLGFDKPLEEFINPQVTTDKRSIKTKV